MSVRVECTNGQTYDYPDARVCGGPHDATSVVIEIHPRSAVPTYVTHPLANVVRITSEQ